MWCAHNDETNVVTSALVNIAVVEVSALQDISCGPRADPEFLMRSLKKILALNFAFWSSLSVTHN